MKYKVSNRLKLYDHFDETFHPFTIKYINRKSKLLKLKFDDYEHLMNYTYDQFNSYLENKKFTEI